MVFSRSSLRLGHLVRRALSEPARFFSGAAVSESVERVTVSEVESGIMHVEFNRPEKMNALDLKTFQQLSTTALALKNNTSVRAVIISGRGKAFCTGLDVKSMVPDLSASSKLLDKPAGTQHSNMAQDAAYLWRQLPVPVIASLHGMVFGGGLQIALGADFRFATPDCKMSVMEAKWGIIPDMSAAVTLRELVRMDVAKELTMTGRIFPASEGLGYGLVTRCVEDPFAESLALARELVGRSPDAVAAAKKLFQDTWVSPERDCLNMETDLQKKLLLSWNQVSTAGRNFGVNLPYTSKKEL